MNNIHTQQSVPPEIQEVWEALGEERMTPFFLRLFASDRRLVPLTALWATFAQVFPFEDLTPTQRRSWLFALLLKGVREDTMAFPSSRGHNWDRVIQPALPLWIRLRKAPEQRQAPAPHWRSYPWIPQLEWVADLPSLSPEWESLLYRIQYGIVHKQFQAEQPIAFRSTQLLGNEKRLQSLLKTVLFRPGRLSLELLGCYTSDPAFPVEEVVQIVGGEPSALVFENKEVWVSACRYLRKHTDPPYGLLCLGEGASFEQSVLHFQRLNVSIKRIEYIGDLDRPGLRTALAASQRARSAGLPPVLPARGTHLAMLASISAMERPEGLDYREGEKCVRPGDERLVEWLPEEVRARVRAILQSGRRIPEEVLGPDQLRQLWG